MKKLFLISLLWGFIAGCSATLIQPEQTKYHSIYDEQGKRTGYIKERDGHITIYDENWKRKGYIKGK